MYFASYTVFFVLLFIFYIWTYFKMESIVAFWHISEKQTTNVLVWNSSPMT